MAKILGLDLGTNSIGWAVVDDEQKKILGTGVRIFPEGVNIAPTNQKETPKNKSRRDVRGARRLNYRFKLRRERLKKVLADPNLSMLPNDCLYTKEKGDKKNLTIELYKLRKEAWEKEIRKDDLGRIFLHLNNHRGFLSNAKEEGESILDEEKAEESGNVKRIAAELQQKIDAAYADGKIKRPLLGCYFNYLIEENSNSYDPNLPIERIRGEGHYTLREMYEQEFDAIWEFQKQFHPELTDENKKKIKDECIFYQRDLRSQKHLRNRCVYEFVTYRKKDKEGNELKNDKGEFIYERKYLNCVPKSSFEFQEFRIWEQLNKLQYKGKGSDHWEELTQQQKELLANTLDRTVQIKIGGKLNDEEKLNLAELLVALGLPKKVSFNANRIIGNVTKTKLIEVLDEGFWNSLPKVPNADNEAQQYSEEERTLWHNVYFASNFIKSRKWLKGEVKSNGPALRKNRKAEIANTSWQETAKKIGLNDEQLEKYAHVAFEPDICSYSRKVLRNLIPWMKQGYHPTEAAIEAGYESASDIRNDHAVLSELVPQLKNNELRNPVVQRGVTEAIKLINTICNEKERDGKLKYGKPDEVHLELSRELRKAKKVRETMHQKNEAKRKERENYAAILSDLKGIQIDPSSDLITKFELYLELEFSKESLDEIKGHIDIDSFKKFCKNLDIRDKEKFSLWKQCKRKDPYEGRTIGLSQLFSSEIEIEHILPYSRSFDDSFLNKTLAFRNFNARKLNKTPLEYFATRPKEELDQFRKLIKKFPKEKQKRFLIDSEEKLDEFRKNQLNNNAYIATELRKHLFKSFPSNKVNVTNGISTAMVRRMLGFNSILNPAIHVTKDIESGKYWARLNEFNELIEYLPITRENKNKEKDIKLEKGERLVEGYISYNEQKDIRKFYPKKTRDDHRHHAIDAITIALISTKINQLIANNTKLPYAIAERIENLSGKEKEVEYAKHNPYNEYGQLKKEVLDKIREEVYEELKGFTRLRDQAKDLTDEILVSHRKDQRITASGKKLVHKTGQHSGGDVAKGQLHEQSYYGQTKDCEEGEYVRRIKIQELSSSQIECKNGIGIIDQNVREAIKNAIAKHGSINKAIEVDRGIYLMNEGRRKKRMKQFDPGIERQDVPIKKVRVKFKSKMIRLRPKETPKLFVPTGDNYLMAIYQEGGEKEKPKRDFKLVTFFDAVQKRKKSYVKENGKQPLYPAASEKNNYPLLQFNDKPVVIKKGDSVLLFENHSDEIDWNNKVELLNRLYKITGIDIHPDGYGRMILLKHNEARQMSKLQEHTGKYKITDNKPKRMMLHTQFKGLIEGIHFELAPTGNIKEITG